MTIRPVGLLLAAGLLLMTATSATAQAEELLEQRYQALIDTVVARLQLGDSSSQQFRTSVAQYLAETEAIFGMHEGKVDQASMEAMTKELDEARAQLDTRLAVFLSQEQVARVRTIMEDLRRQARETGADSGF